MSDTTQNTLPSVDTVTGSPEWIELDDVPDGAPEHMWYAIERGISSGVMVAASWTSVDTRTEAEAILDEQCGSVRFSKPVMDRLDGGALIMPRRRIDGSAGAPQIRLDDPRVDEDGKATKFETPSRFATEKAGLVLAPSAPMWWAPRSWISDVTVPVIISEGPSRELAMVTAAIAEEVAVLPVTLTGVSMGTGREHEEDHTGKRVVKRRWLEADIKKLALPGRSFYIAFDHDVLVKRQVRRELGHLVDLLREAGCVVRIIVPAAVDGVTGTGLDDALAAGQTLQGMVAESLDELPSSGRGPTRRSTILATLDEPTKTEVLEGEVTFPDDEAPADPGYVPGVRGRVIDATPYSLGDLTGTASGIDQLSTTVGLPSAEVIRLHGSITWKDVYTAKSIARGLASLLQDFFRYVTETSSWIRYDGSRWVPTQASVVRQLVEGVTQAERDAAVASGDENREALSTTLNLSRFDASVVTSLEPRLSVSVHDLDADPDVLNVLNGTLDLQTGTLYPHSPSHLMTKIAGAAYRTEDSYSEDEAEALAQAKKDVAAVVSTTGPETEVHDHLELIMGQSATGHRATGDISLVVMEGGASNGKSSRFNLLQATLGGYCVQVSRKVLQEESSDSNERVALWGARLVLVEELTNRSGSIDGSAIKDLTGTKSLKVRPLYSEWLTVPMTARIIASTNSLLRVTEDDLGMWRRLQRIVHPYTYVEKPTSPRHRPRDVRMENIEEDSYVREEWLRLLLRGAMRWYAMPDRKLPGHDAWPDKIVSDTAVWRSGENPAARMVEDLLEPCEGAVITLADLRRAANLWLHHEGALTSANSKWSEKTVRTAILQADVVRDEWGVTSSRQRMTAERAARRSVMTVRDGRGVHREDPTPVDNAIPMAFGMKFTDYVLDVRNIW
ncbi:MAG: DUF3854 domain-containing protein [Dermabacteraceae bacterium]